MDPLIIIGAFVVITLVIHHRTFDIANGSAGAALILAITSSLVALVQGSWQAALLVFFFAAFAGFAVAYLVGLLYRVLGSQQRRDFIATGASPASRRVAIGAAGGILISLTFLATLVARRLQDGAWPAVPIRVWMAFMAFFLLGVGYLIGIYIRKHRSVQSPSPRR